MLEKYTGHSSAFEEQFNKRNANTFDCAQVFNGKNYNFDQNRSISDTDDLTVSGQNSKASIAEKKRKGYLTKKLEQNLHFLDVNISPENTKEKQTTTWRPGESLKSPARRQQTLSQKWKSNLTFRDVMMREQDAEDMRKRTEIVPTKPTLRNKLAQNLKYLDIVPSNKQTVSRTRYEVRCSTAVGSPNLVQLDRHCAVLSDQGEDDLQETDNDSIGTRGNIQFLNRSFEIPCRVQEFKAENDRHTDGFISVEKADVYKENFDATNINHDILRSSDCSGLIPGFTSIANTMSDDPFYRKNAESEERTTRSKCNLRTELNIPKCKPPVVDNAANKAPILRHKPAEVMTNNAVKGFINEKGRNGDAHGCYDQMVFAKNIPNGNIIQESENSNMEDMLNEGHSMLMDTVIPTKGEKQNMNIMNGIYKHKENRSVKLLKKAETLPENNSSRACIVTKNRSIAKKHATRQRRHRRFSVRKSRSLEGEVNKRNKPVKHKAKKKNISTVFKKYTQNRATVNKKHMARSNIDIKTVKNEFDVMWLVQGEPMHCELPVNETLDSQDMSLHGDAERAIENNTLIDSAGDDMATVDTDNLLRTLHSDFTVELNKDKDNVHYGTEFCEHKLPLDICHDNILHQGWPNRGQSGNCLISIESSGEPLTDTEQAVVAAAETASTFLRKCTNSNGDMLCYFPITQEHLEEESLWVTTHALLRSFGDPGLVYSRLYALSQKTKADTSVILRKFLDLFYIESFGKDSKCPLGILESVCNIALHLRCKETEIIDNNPFCNKH